MLLTLILHTALLVYSIMILHIPLTECIIHTQLDNPNAQQAFFIIICNSKRICPLSKGALDQLTRT